MKEEDAQIPENGKAKTSIKLYPTSESKIKAYQESRDRQMWRRLKMRNDADQVIGGYGATVRRMLAKVERLGGKFLRVRKWGQDTTDESVDADSDEGP